MHDGRWEHASEEDRFLWERGNDRVFRCGVGDSCRVCVAEEVGMDGW